MLNLESAYQEAGEKCGEARNQHDEARALFHNNWFRRAKALEQTEDRDKAQGLFDAGYSAARTPRGLAL